MKRRGFFRSLLGLVAGAIAAPLLPKPKMVKWGRMQTSGDYFLFTSMPIHTCPVMKCDDHLRARDDLARRFASVQPMPDGLARDLCSVKPKSDPVA